MDADLPGVVREEINACQCWSLRDCLKRKVIIERDFVEQREVNRTSGLNQLKGLGQPSIGECKV